MLQALRFEFLSDLPPGEDWLVEIILDNGIGVSREAWRKIVSVIKLTWPSTMVLRNACGQFFMEEL